LYAPCANSSRSYGAPLYCSTNSSVVIADFNCCANTEWSSRRGKHFSSTIASGSLTSNALFIKRERVTVFMPSCYTRQGDGTLAAGLDPRKHRPDTPCQLLLAVAQKNWSGEMDSNHRLYSFASCCLGPLGHPRANHCVLQCSYITIGKPDCQQLITISCIGNFLLFWSRLLGFGCYLGLNCRASIIVVGSLRRCPANLHSIYVSVTIN
jgi:hypothetical protein